MSLNRSNDGVLLDGHGQHLKDGDPPVYLPYEIYPDVEFNDSDFGDFVGEEEIEEIETVEYEAVMNQIMGSGMAIRQEVNSPFIARHRLRPQKKIVLSNRPTHVYQDGFGTHILNISLSSAHLEQELMNQLTNLMHEFIEGKASINNSGNEDVTFVA